VAGAVEQLVTGYGYVALGAVVGVESIGVPVPGETALVAAAIYGGITHHLALWAIVAVAFGAAVVGDQIGYLIGRRGGSRLLVAIGRRSRRAELNVAVVRRLFADRGTSVLVMARFVSVVRTYVAVLAGASGLSWRRFTAANVAAAALWSSSLGVLSYMVARSTRHAALIPEIAGVVIAVAAGAIGLFWVRDTRTALRNPLAGSSNPLAGSGNEPADRSDPLAASSNPLAGSDPLASSNPLAGRGNPLAGRGNPLAGRGNPLAGRGNRLAGGGNPLAERGNVLARAAGTGGRAPGVGLAESTPLAPLPGGAKRPGR
jgi:membrane protein DedA with SNARE-associated domain